MPLYEFEGATPRVHPTAWVAPTASVIGDVTIGEGASVWFGVVLRGDFAPIVIEPGANVQDGSVLHSGPDATIVGEGATIGHGCVVHTAKIGREALIGNGALVLDGSVIGERALVAAGAVVVPGTTVPDLTLVVGAPAKAKGTVTGTPLTWVEMNPQVYRDLAQRYRLGGTREVSADETTAIIDPA